MPVLDAFHSLLKFSNTCLLKNPSSSEPLTESSAPADRFGLRLLARFWDYTTPCVASTLHLLKLQRSRRSPRRAAMFSCRAAWQRCGPLARRAAYRLPLDERQSTSMFLGAARCLALLGHGDLCCA
ncbi:hypothetical protein AMECASPLE_035438 [Ameca splendens]|uniref:Uncharacterized protein n=1 Tax=Ameca splendens TaxID=208324 RepID=A0ABV0Y815_9TELE